MPLKSQGLRLKTENISKVTDSVERSPFWQVNICPRYQEMPYVLWKSKCHCRVHKNWWPVPILSLSQLYVASLDDWYPTFRDGVERRPKRTASEAYKLSNEPSLNPHLRLLTPILVLFSNICFRFPCRLLSGFFTWISYNFITSTMPCAYTVRVVVSSIYL
jgi:hypothetical protein